MNSLQNQVKTLNSTVTLLKDQLNSMKNENKALYEMNNEMKSKLNEKNGVIEGMKKEKWKTKKDLESYYEIMPKLDEIE